MVDKVWRVPQKGGIARRLQEVADGEYAEEVYTRDMWDSAITLGRAFLCTSERITTDLTDTHIVGHLVNTSADQVVTLVGLVSNIAPNAMVVGRVTKNPTGDVPDPNITPFGMRELVGGQEDPAFTIGVGKQGSGPTGGTLTDLRLTTFQGRNELKLGLPVGPGQSVAVHIGLGAIEPGDGTFAVYVAQEAVSA